MITIPSREVLLLTPNSSVAFIASGVSTTANLNVVIRQYLESGLSAIDARAKCK
jgi:hypothetical protein